MTTLSQRQVLKMLVFKEVSSKQALTGVRFYFGEKGAAGRELLWLMGY